MTRGVALREEQLQRRSIRMGTAKASSSYMPAATDTVTKYHTIEMGGTTSEVKGLSA